MGQQTGATHEVLSDRWWRRRHSLWVLVPVLGTAMLGFVGFVYVWARVRTRPMARAAGVASAVSLAAWLVSLGTTDGSGSMSSFGAMLFLALWVGQVVHAVRLNRDYLRGRAAAREAAPWYAQPAPVAATPPRTSTPGRPVPLVQRLEALSTQAAADPRLPADARAAVQRVASRLRDVLWRSDERADADQLYVIDRIITDYVPTSLDAYTSLPSTYASTARGSGGRTPHQELLRQLDLVERQISEIADAMYAGDAARLEAQGRFLEDRFRRSELDLG